MSEWEQYLTRAKARYGDALDLSEINRDFLPYFCGPRVKVRIYGEEITGTVSVTTGWRPALMLMRRSNSMGSSDLLTGSAELVAVQYGRAYVNI